MEEDIFHANIHNLRVYECFVLVSRHLEIMLQNDRSTT